MAKNKHGAEYKPVTQQQILDAIPLDGITAYEIGAKLWPHLDGRGPSRGGPSNCAVAASFQLSKLERAGKVWFDFKPRLWKRR